MSTKYHCDNCQKDMENEIPIRLNISLIFKKIGNKDIGYELCSRECFKKKLLDFLIENS